MPLDFPASPITGATYTAPNGTIWVWDGAKWTNGVYVGTAYAPINAPTFTGDARAVTPSSNDADTSIATTAFVRTGTATNDNAASGQVGEYLTVSQSSGAAMTNNTAMNITSLSLTAGDWDVEGTGYLGSSAGCQGGIVALNTTSATLPAANLLGYYQILLTAPSQLLGSFIAPTGLLRLSLAVTATVYLIGFALFSGGTVSAQGSIRARRCR